MHSNSVQGLGISFYNGDLDGACKLLEMGGLVTAPSGPGLAQDLTGVLSTAGPWSNLISFWQIVVYCACGKMGSKTRSFPNLRPYFFTGNSESFGLERRIHILDYA